MKSDKFRDYTIGICAIIFVAVFSVSTLYNTYTAWKWELKNPMDQLDSLGVYAVCNSEDTKHMLSVTLDNYGQSSI